MVRDTGRVNFTSDGLGLAPEETAKLLLESLAGTEIEGDYYSIGGPIEKLEREFARLLGKEAAVFMPSGTLANHIALRSLSADGSRIVVHGQSHIYRDSGDCLQRLSGKNLLPLEDEETGNGAGFSLQQVEDVVARTAAEKVETGVGVLSIESPVRRMNGKIFPHREMTRIVEYAKSMGFRLHLDGARLLIETAYYRLSPAEYVEAFDTVYVSLYKYLNAPFGAILSGEEKLIRTLYHQRRMFGGGLHQSWPSAVLALASLPHFEADYTRVIEATKRLEDAVNGHEGYTLESVPNGTNVYKLILPSGLDPSAFREKLSRKNIQLPPSDPGFNGFFIKTNESILSADPEEIAEKISRAV